MEKFAAISLAFRIQGDPDFGVDAEAELIDEEKPTGRLLGIQLKAGASYFREETDDSWVFRPKAKHVKYWLGHTLPVLVCLCDVDSRVVYWERVSPESIVSTGKGYKLIVPKNQTVDADCSAQLRDILTPVVARSRYTITQEEDISHNTAKRSAFHVVLNGSSSKAEIATIARQVTYEGAKRRYYRNHLVEARWGDADAMVVCAYIYPSISDFGNRVNYCRSQWVHDDLPERDRPMPIAGDDVGDNVVVQWNDIYDTLTKAYAENEVPKGEFLSVALPVTKELKTLFEFVKTHLMNLSRREITEKEFLNITDRAMIRIREIDEEIMDLPTAPFECQDLEGVIDEVGTFVGNIALHYSERDMQMRDETNRLQNAMLQVQSATEAFKRFEFEVNKIR